MKGRVSKVLPNNLCGTACIDTWGRGRVDSSNVLPGFHLILETR